MKHSNVIKTWILNYLVNKMTKKATILYWDIKACIEDNPMTGADIARKLGLDYQMISFEIANLIKLGKVIRVKHDAKMMLLWTNVVPTFEYELSNNIVTLRKVKTQFVGAVTEVAQMKVPNFFIKAIGEKIKMTTKMNLMLEVKAVYVNNMWYKIEQEKEK